MATAEHPPTSEGAVRFWSDQTRLAMRALVRAHDPRKMLHAESTQQQDNGIGRVHTRQTFTYQNGLVLPDGNDARLFHLTIDDSEIKLLPGIPGLGGFAKRRRLEAHMLSAAGNPLSAGVEAPILGLRDAHCTLLPPEANQPKTHGERIAQAAAIAGLVGACLEVTYPEGQVPEELSSTQGDLCNIYERCAGTPDDGMPFWTKAPGFAALGQP